jgi:hypothetical protein
LNTLLTAPPAGMGDVEFLHAVQEAIRRQRAAAPSAELQRLAAEVDRRLQAAVQLRDGLVFRYAGPTLHDFVVGIGDAPQRFKVRADGAHALAFALLNPGRQLGLRGARTRRPFARRSTPSIGRILALRQRWRLPRPSRARARGYSSARVRS